MSSSVPSTEPYYQNGPLELTFKNPPCKFKQEYPPIGNMVIENEPAKYTYPVQITNPFERETWTISTDHCYARPWNWRPESSFLKPAKALFMPKNVETKPFFGRTSSVKCDKFIDVESEAEVPRPVYDLDEARNLMEECEKHAILSKTNGDDENWEEKINRNNWTSAQHKLFSGFMTIFSNFQLGKLAYAGLKNEPVLRRTVIDKAAQRVRRLFNAVSYETKLLQWIHQLILDNVDQETLSAYLDILQTLKNKIPKFVEKMINGPSALTRTGPLNNENLQPLMKRPWDPVEASLMQDKPKKLPSNPIIVLMPCAPNMSKRNHKWYTLLSNLAQVVTVPSNFGSSSHRLTMTNCVDQMFSLARGKIQEIRENFHGRHIILAGFGAGATLALQVAQVENVFCVISLGFSMLTAEGKRGEPDDSLLELQCPVLFVIGQCSSTSFQEDVEDMRERMRIETGLIVIGSADNNLIISKRKKREEGITQAIVNRCIIDEIGEFISSLILSPYPPQVRQSPTNIPTDALSKKVKQERKRYNSTTSSLDSEPPSPTPRITRPVGRPAGKTKCKLDAKWAAQIAQGTASNASAPATLPPISSLSSAPSHVGGDLASSTGISSSASSSSDTVPFNHSAVFPGGVVPAASSQKHDAEPLQSKKLRTLKALMVEKGALKSGAGGEQVGSDQARMQAYNLSRNMAPGGQLSSLLQGGLKTIPAVQQKQSNSPTIKVLENVSISSPLTAKLIAGAGSRALELSKGGRSPITNVVLLPDGKFKTVNANRPITLKGADGNPIVLSLPGKSGQIRRTKIIPPKRIPSPVKQPLLSLAQPLDTSLPPATNLTSQDIMDLPIIFADDNQMLDPNLPTDLSTTGNSAANGGSNTTDSSSAITNKFVSPTSKFVIVTKPTPTSGLNNFIITSSSGLKRPSPVNLQKPPTKYTKIILSKKSVEPFINRMPGSGALNVSNENGPSFEMGDIENQLVATAVLKPTFSGDKRPTTVVGAKREPIDFSDQLSADEDDPDYVPPKNLKL